jgi:hypothetical protein
LQKQKENKSRLIPEIQIEKGRNLGGMERGFDW